jgi:solute carrier family 25 carnitine/acylcarnitine transporter 20/29
VQFVVFARVKNLLTDNGNNFTLNRIAAAGAFTGAVVAGVEGPQDLIKSQMQAQMMSPKDGSAAAATPRYTSTGHCAQTILREHGVRGLTQGLSATVARNTVGVSAYFYFYEAVRKLQAGDQPVSSLSSLQVLLAGGCGGMGYWILSYPLDIIKSAMQTDVLDAATRRYRSLAGTARLLWQEGGVKRYTAGLAPCLLRSFPANAAGFATYEAVKKALEEGAVAAAASEMK